MKDLIETSSLVFKLAAIYLTIILSEINHSLRGFNQLNHLKNEKRNSDFLDILKRGFGIWGNFFVFGL